MESWFDILYLTQWHSDILSVQILFGWIPESSPELHVSLYGSVSSCSWSKSRLGRSISVYYEVQSSVWQRQALICFHLPWMKSKWAADGRSFSFFKESISELLDLQGSLLFWYSSRFTIKCSSVTLKFEKCEVENWNNGCVL